MDPPLLELPLAELVGDDAVPEPPAPTAPLAAAPGAELVVADDFDWIKDDPPQPPSASPRTHSTAAAIVGGGFPITVCAHP